MNQDLKLDPLKDDSPRGVRWRIRSRINRLITRHYAGSEWGSVHYKAAADLFRRWETGELHEVELEPYITGQLQLQRREARRQLRELRQRGTGAESGT